MGNCIFSESLNDNKVATMYKQIKVFLIWTYFQLIGVWKILQEQIWDRHRSISLAQMPNVKNKTLVITGANRGIGLEAVKKLIPYGCHVIIGCRRPTEASEIIMKSLEEEKAIKTESEITQLQAHLSLKLSSFPGLKGPIFIGKTISD